MPPPPHISSVIDLADLREAERLSRYRHNWILRIFQEREAWLMTYCVACVTAVNLVGREHVPWSTVGIVGAAAAALFLLRKLGEEFWLRRRLTKLNRRPIRFRITVDGVYFVLADGSVRVRRWPELLAAKAGSRVLLLYYRPLGGLWRRRKFFIIPLQGLSSAERVDVLTTLPDRIQSETVHRTMASLRLR